MIVIQFTNLLDAKLVFQISNKNAEMQLFQSLGSVRPVSLKDMDRFTSPWAVAAEDEMKFERTVSFVGRLLRNDIHLQVSQ